jgi:hypothetical protein
MAPTVRSQVAGNPRTSLVSTGQRAKVKSPKILSRLRQGLSGEGLGRQDGPGRAGQGDGAPRVRGRAADRSVFVG